MSTAMKPTTVTAAELDLWDRTRAALTWHCPAFTHIFYEMMNTAGQKTIALFTEDVPIAATDGSTLILNPKTFFKYNLSERIFICAHEIMHCVLNHCVLLHMNANRGKIVYPDGTSLKYDPELANKAQDLVINDILVTSGVGQFNKDWLHDTNVATANDSWMDVYRKLYKEQEGGGGKARGTGFDQHLAPGASKGLDPHDSAQQRNEQRWQAAVAAGAAVQRAQGKMPAGLDRFFGEVLNPQVPWREKIQALFARRLGSGSYDWQRPDRRWIVRDIYTPARSGFGTGTVVVAIDTSGSIGQEELDMFLAEVSGILEECRPRELFIMWCDAKVHRVDELEDPSDLNVVRSKKAPGGGGTAFEPVFDKVHELNLTPDALVYLTDGMGSFPTQPPRYPVIWGSIYPQSKYPFGDVVDVPKQARK
jgi:predicted metal-dependent peptidase